MVFTCLHRMRDLLDPITGMQGMLQFSIPHAAVVQT